MEADTYCKAFWLAHKIFKNGTCLEFGVSRGTTYMWMAEQILKSYPESKLIGFDSWMGLPKEAAGVWWPWRHREGAFGASKSNILGHLKELGVEESDPRFTFVDGFFEKSLTEEVRLSIKNLIYINIDSDLYISAIQALTFITPLLRKGIVINMDNFRPPEDKLDADYGENLAWKEWLLKNPNIKAAMVETNKKNQRYFKIESV